MFKKLNFGWFTCAAFGEEGAAPAAVPTLCALSKGTPPATVWGAAMSRSTKSATPPREARRRGPCPGVALAHRVRARARRHRRCWSRARPTRRSARPCRARGSRPRHQGKPAGAVLVHEQRDVAAREASCPGVRRAGVAGLAMDKLADAVHVHEHRALVARVVADAGVERDGVAGEVVPPAKAAAGVAHAQKPISGWRGELPRVAGGAAVGQDGIRHL